MYRRLGNVGYPITFADLVSSLEGIFDERVIHRFAKSLLEATGGRHVYLTNAGITSFFMILKTLGGLSSRREVVLPAYTASSLVAALRKANMKPVLCDISLEDFNMDADELARRITPQTLCVTAVHMFGIPWAGIRGLREALPEDVFLVEDGAQAWGARIDEKPVGAFGDVGFFSFNRGKNLPTFTGGCVVTNAERLVFFMEKTAQMSLRPKPWFKRFSDGAKMWAMALAFRPAAYAYLYPLISCFKETSMRDDFEVAAYTRFQAALGLSLLRHSSRSFDRRTKNGLFLIDALKDHPGVIVPKIREGIRPVFNRFPLVIKNTQDRDRISEKLAGAGIETSRFYFKPLHHLYDLGYEKDDFPNAVYFAERLLTLPVHPLVTQRDLDVMVRTIKEI